MTAFEMPLIPGLYDYEIRVELEGVAYLFRFRWNTRAEAWFVDVADANGELIVAGRKCLADEFLLEQFRARAGVPPGILHPFDTTRRQVDPAQDDFGTRVVLYYLDSLDVAEAIADGDAEVL